MYKYQLVNINEANEYLTEGWVPVFDNEGRPCTVSTGVWSYQGISSGPTVYIWLVSAVNVTTNYTTNV